jgi:hypothetical protein
MPLKSSLNVVFCYRFLEYCVKCGKEVLLADTCPHLLLDLSTVRLLERAKTSDMKRLDYMG